MNIVGIKDYELCKKFDKTPFQDLKKPDTFQKNRYDLLLKVQDQLNKIVKSKNQDETDKLIGKKRNLDFTNETEKMEPS